MIEQSRTPPVVESQEVASWIAEPTTHRQRVIGRSLDDRPLRPLLRPSTPVLTVLDDGTFDSGEDFRLRGERFVIGRSSGDLVIPHDQTLSSTHAEIRRVATDGRVSWHLIDLESVNGTFVRIESAILYPDSLVSIGLRRFSLVNPLAAALARGGDGTHEIDSQVLPADLWPSLVEAGKQESVLRFPLRKQRVTIGRAGGTCDITIDDPHLALHHATLIRSEDHSWHITPEKTLNGVWVSTRAVRLTALCHFLCGEQFFRFAIR
jgi:pSer/pThr/pTyr-binding forkhead associated (FHA) protein